MAREYIAIAFGGWARAKTQSVARMQMARQIPLFHRRTETEYVIFECDPAATADEMGTIHQPKGSEPPKEVHRGILPIKTGA
jgi:hypothetical protein